MTENILELSSANFKDTVQSSGSPVLVDFWAPWCGPCKAIAPILEEIATEMDGKVRIGKVNVDNEQELAAQFNIRAIPTLLLFKDGAIVEQFVGMASKGDLASKISAHV